MSVDRRILFFFNDTATTEIYTLSLHDALPIYIFLMTRAREESVRHGTRDGVLRALAVTGGVLTPAGMGLAATLDRKSTRLNSRHANNLYAVFCFKKKTCTSFTLPSILLYIYSS